MIECPGDELAAQIAEMSIAEHEEHTIIREAINSRIASRNNTLPS